MANYLVFDNDGYCIAKHGNTDVTITQDTSIIVQTLADYPGMDWIYSNSTIKAMTETESRLRRRKLKSAKLQAAELAYESFLTNFGLSINAKSDEIMGALIQMKASGTLLPFGGVQLNASEVQGIISGLMHDIEVNGGSWREL
jgi:hypothetical protein